MTYRPLHPTFSATDLLAVRMEDRSIRKSERTRLRLMISAAELLNEQSFDVIRNIDICQNAGVANGVLNTYYKDKKELVVVLLKFFAKHLEIEFNRHNKEQGEEDDIYVKLFDTIHYIFRCAQSNVGIWRLLLVESDQHPELTLLYKQVLNYWSGYLADQLPNEYNGKKLSKKERQVMALLLGGMLDDAIRHYFLSDTLINNFAPNQIIEMITTLRYTAIFGKYPSATSIKKVNQLLISAN